MKIRSAWFFVAIIVAFAFGFFTSRLNAEIPTMVVSSKLEYKPKSDGKPNPYLFGVMATASIDLIPTTSTKGEKMALVEQNVTSDWVIVNTRREKLNTPNVNKVVAYLDATTGMWRPFTTEKLKGGNGKLMLNKLDCTFNLAGKSTRYQIEGYVTYDPTTKTVSQPEELRISYYDSLAKQTVRRKVEISGKSTQVAMKMVHEGSQYSLFDSHLHISSRQVTAGEKPLWVTEFSGTNVPPSLLAVVQHWWGTAVFPFAD